MSLGCNIIFNRKYYVSQSAKHLCSTVSRPSGGRAELRSKEKGGPTMVDRYLARILADLQDRLVELGVDPDDAENLVDDFEESVEKLLASSEGDTDSRDEDK